jgi:tetratricopeptide (TPR) repeat protein
MTTSHEAPLRSAALLPLQLPPRLIGRDAQVAKVRDQVQNGKPTFIYGPSGSGKTALAGMFAVAYAKPEFSGALWLSVNSDLPINIFEQLLARVGRAYGIGEVTNTPTPQGMVAAVAAALTRHKPLIVIDGKIDTRTLNDFLTRCAEGLAVLIASDELVAAGNATLVELGKLTPQEAVQAYKQLTNDSDDAAIAALVKAADYQPFALAVLGGSARVNKQTADTYAKALQSLPLGNPATNALTLAYKMLNPNALQGLLLTLGMSFNGQASAELMSMMASAPQEAIVKFMDVLVAQNLVIRTLRYGEPYYTLHPITIDFVRSVLRDQLDAQQTKAAVLLMQYALKHSANPNGEKLAAEMDNFLALAKWAADKGDAQTAYKLAEALNNAADFVQAHGYTYEVSRISELGSSARIAPPPAAAPLPSVRFTASAAAAPRPAEVLGDEVEMDDEFIDPDAVEETNGQYDAPSFTDEDLKTRDLDKLRGYLLLTKQSGDRTRQVSVLRAIGRAQVEAEMQTEAISTYTEVLQMYQSSNNRAGQLEMEDTLSILMNSTDNYSAAVLHASQGIKLATELDEHDSLMHLLTTLGDAKQELGESADAIRAYNQSLEQARKHDDERHEALILHKLGFVQLDDGDAATAIQLWNTALPLLRAQKRPELEGKTLGGLGTAHGELGRWSEAIQFHTSAMRLARVVGDPTEEALQLNNLANACVKANQLGQAVLHYRQALHLAYQSGDQETIVNGIVDLARLLITSRRHQAITELLVDDGLTHDSHDRNLRALKERIMIDPSVAQASVSGSARDYARNAYAQLEA